MKRMDRDVRAASYRSLREYPEKPEMRAVRFVDDHGNAAAVRRGADPADIGDNALVGRRGENDGGGVRVSRKRVPDRLGGDGAPKTELRFRHSDEDGVRSRDLKRVKDRFVTVPRDDGGSAFAAERGDGGERARGASVHGIEDFVRPHKGRGEPLRLRDNPARVAQIVEPVDLRYIDRSRGNGEIIRSGGIPLVARHMHRQNVRLRVFREPLEDGFVVIVHFFVAFSDSSTPLRMTRK